MANFIFNVAKGRIAEKVSDGATLGLLLLKAADTDAVLRDLDTIADILANASTTESDFTNYARATLANVAATVDDANDDVDVDCDDVLFASAGGASNNNNVAAIIFEDVGGADASRIPLCKFDAVFTTDGNDVTIGIPAGGFYTST
ncbi:MAG: hypothetical protein AAGG48_14555 [Planctomycetota bacterium]